MTAGTPFLDTANEIRGKYAFVSTSSGQFASSKIDLPQVVYLAYVFSGYWYAPELVGVFASKAGAYKAVRNRLWELIYEQWDFANGNDKMWRNDYQFSWRVVETEAKR